MYQELAQRKIQQCKKHGNVVLDLSGLRLGALPPEIFKLKWIRKLKLGSNNLSTLPDLFHKLPRLQEVYLSHNRLSELPMSLVKNPNLRALSLYNNQFKKLPDHLYVQIFKNRKQAGLKMHLHLQNNQLSSIDNLVGVEEAEIVNLSANPIQRMKHKIFRTNAALRLGWHHIPLAARNISKYYYSFDTEGNVVVSMEMGPHVYLAFSPQIGQSWRILSKHEIYKEKRLRNLALNWDALQNLLVLLHSRNREDAQLGELLLKGADTI